MYESLCNQIVCILNGILQYLCQIVNYLQTYLVWTNGEFSVARLDATSSGTITAGAFSISIANVGNANGIVLGENIVPNQTINITAMQNPVTRKLLLLPSISYDGTGTTLSVLIMR